METKNQTEQKSRPRGGRRGWLEVLTLAAGTFGLVTTEFLPVGLLREIGRDFDISDGVTGYLMTVPGLVAAFAAPGLILLSRSLDRRIILLALTVLIIASSLLVATAPYYPIALAGRVLLGLAIGGIWSFAVPAGYRLVDPKDGNRATSIILAGISAGTVLGVPAGTMLGNLLGWRAAFGATAVFAFVVLLAQIFVLRPLPAEKQLGMSDFLGILKIPAGRVGLYAILFVIAGHFAAFTYLKPFLKDLVGFGDETITVVLLVYGVAGFLGTFLGGWLVSRSVLLGYALSAFVLGSALIVGVFSGPSPVLAILVVAIWGAAFGAVPVAAQVWMQTAAPSLIEGSSALIVSAFQISVALGAFVGGVVVDRSGGGVAAAMSLGGTLAILATVTLLLLARKSPVTT